MNGKLTGKQVQEISDAILNAYGSVAALRMMVRIELDEILDEIAGGESLRIVTFNLITWAERSGRVEDLVRGAARYNPGNQALRQLVREWSQPNQSGESAPDVSLTTTAAQSPEASKARTRSFIVIRSATKGTATNTSADNRSEAETEYLGTPGPHAI